MVRRSPTLPRKSASQVRSKLTVDALLDGTARVLTREGYSRASTNRIATVAGVSIGSLYQYFPNKDALVAALVARHNREMLQLLRDAMLDLASHDLERAMRGLVRAMIAAHRVDPELHRIFSEEVPRMGQLAEVETIKREILTLVRSYMDQRRDEIEVENLDTAAFICVTTVETLTHEIVIRHPRLSDREEADYVEQVTRLMIRYLGK